MSGKEFCEHLCFHCVASLGLLGYAEIYYRVGRSLKWAGGEKGMNKEAELVAA